MFDFVCGSCLCAEAGEGTLIVGVDLLASTTAATRGTAASATGSTATLATTTTAAATALATEFTTAASTASTTVAALARLGPGVVDVKNSLYLLFALTLGFGTGAGKVSLLLATLLAESLGGCPLLVLLGTFVGCTGGEATTKGQLLLGLLGKVFGVGLLLLFSLRLTVLR